MHLVSKSLIGLGVFLSLQAQAAPRAFQIFSSKQITAHVDRFYDKDRSAFATIFCRGDAAEVMIVDGRISDLDGKTFFFRSLEACEGARQVARQRSGSCVTQLVVDTAGMSAKVLVSRCK
ncbi:hypothetical protein D3C87_1006390 [compost metagenome]